MRTLYGIKIHGDARGMKTEHDGRWLRQYDPKAGRNGHIVTTEHVAEALIFRSKTEAIALWSAANGKRDDGKPNRPLTAFTVSVEPLWVSTNHAPA